MPSARAPERERLTVAELAEQGGRLCRGAMLVDGPLLFEVRAFRGAITVSTKTGRRVAGEGPPEIKLLDVADPIPLDPDEEAALGAWIPYPEVSKFEVLRAAG